MPPIIEVQNDAAYPIDEAHLRAAAKSALTHEGYEGHSLTIVLTEDVHVAALNAQFRGVDTPTDILSFPSDEPPIIEADEPPYLGDLVIAYPYASTQAAKLGHVQRDNFALLVVHGTLHLLGYDHDTPENRAVMWSVQEQILRRLNIPLEIVPALEDGVAQETDDGKPT